MPRVPKVSTFRFVMISSELMPNEPKRSCCFLSVLFSFKKSCPQNTVSFSLSQIFLLSKNCPLCLPCFHLTAWKNTYWLVTVSEALPVTSANRFITHLWEAACTSRQGSVLRLNTAGVHSCLCDSLFCAFLANLCALVPLSVVKRALIPGS